MLVKNIKNPQAYFELAQRFRTGQTFTRRMLDDFFSERGYSKTRTTIPSTERRMGIMNELTGVIAKSEKMWDSNKAPLIYYDNTLARKETDFETVKSRFKRGKEY